MFYHYIKSFLKSIKKNKYFHFINLIGFSVGFTLLAINYIYIAQEFSYDRFHENLENIYRVNCGEYGVTPLCLEEHIKGQIPGIQNTIRFCKDEIDAKWKNKNIRINNVYYTDPDIFEVFTFKLIEGSPDALKNLFSMVISKSTAIELFNNTSPLGQTITGGNGLAYIITGIMEDFPSNSHIQANAFISIESLRHYKPDMFNCGSWSNLTYIMTSSNIDINGTGRKLNTLLENYRMGPTGGKIPLKLEPLKKIYFDQENNKYDGCKHGEQQTVWIYMIISISILCIIIINYINQTTVQLTSRVKETAIRKINGAKKHQIIKQFMTESLGVVLISLAISIISIEIFLPRICSLLNLSIEINNRTIIYLIFTIITVFIGGLSGYVPGKILSRINENTALKGEIRIQSKGFYRELLTIVQLVILTILINFGLLVGKQLQYILNKDIGFNYNHVLSIPLTGDLNDKKASIKKYLLQNPDIKAASFSDGLIGSGFSKSPMGKRGEEKLCYKYSVDADYFDLYKIEIMQGRNFSWDFPSDVGNTCVINEAACKIFNYEQPLDENLGTRKIIGVIKNFNYLSLHNEIEPLVISNENYGDILQIKISGSNIPKTIHYIENTCKQICPEFSFNYSFVEDTVRSLYKSEYDLKDNINTYTVVTIIIAFLGLFGLTLFLLKKKEKEVSIRKVYGAKISTIIKLLTRKYIYLIIISNIIAVPITLYIITNWLNNFQYRADISIWIFVKTFLMIILVNLIAIVSILIKTSRVNPIVILKNE